MRVRHGGRRRSLTGATACSVLSIALTVACTTRDAAPPVATLAATIERPVAAPGSPIAIRYTMASTGSSRLPDGNWLFVHFVDADGEILWTDDHAPEVPTGQWRPDEPASYTRTTFVPRTAYAGPVFVDAGVFDPKTAQRLTLTGTDQGMSTYRLGRFTVQPNAGSIFVVFGDGWHDAEAGSEGLGVSWRWSRGAATLSFRNPKRDAELLLEIDQPLAASVGRPQLQVLVGDTPVGTLQVEGPKTIVRIPLARAAMGDTENVDLRLVTRPTFVPAAVRQLRSIDSRELGVRVFNAYVEPH